MKISIIRGVLLTIVLIALNGCANHAMHREPSSVAGTRKHMQNCMERQKDEEGGKGKGQMMGKCRQKTVEKQPNNTSGDQQKEHADHN